MSAFTPHEYQEFVLTWLEDRIYVRDEIGAGLFLDPGLGKSATVLQYLEDRKRGGDRQKALIVAPLRVCHAVWPQEIHKWQFDLSHLILHGSPQRRAQALSEDVDLMVTTPDLLHWLEPLVDPGRFDLVVLDESSKFKTWGSRRTRALRRLIGKIPKRVILTGTPASDSLADIFPQVFTLDDGAALGRTLSHFRARYCYRGGYEGREWLMKDDAGPKIEEAIHHLVVRLDGRDHLDLPAVLEHDVRVDLTPTLAKKYKKLARELVAELTDGSTLVASSAGAKYAKLRQFANGILYEEEDDGFRVTHVIHDAKLDALDDLIEELAGKRLLVFYQFHADRDRLERAYPDARCLHGGMGVTAARDIIDAWNANRIRLLLAQPQACGHGLNLQESSCQDICWYGLPDSLEVYTQANARVFRQGVNCTQLRIHHLVTAGTVDTVIRRRLRAKDTAQSSLLDALKRHASEIADG